ncbi:MAG: MFS transporter [Pseudomonadota bacterium]
MITGFLSLRPHARFLAFGFLLSFWSGFGQTYLFALFGGEIRAHFDLSAGDFGAIYSIGTLGGAVALIYLGRLIDRADLRLYAVAVALALAIGCLILWQATSIGMLVAAVFALRLAGQGLMGHTALTAMGRYFDESRGRAVSVATIGHPAGEAFWPAIAVLSIGALGWQQSWGLYGLITALFMPPMILWLLRGHDDRHKAYLARLDLIRQVSTATSNGSRARFWQISLSDRVWRLLPALLSLPFIITGLFFHQVEVVSQKGWTLGLVAQAFIAYSLASILAMAFSGPLIDQITAIRTIRFGLLPMIAAAAVLMMWPGIAAAYLYFFLAGLAGGLMSTIAGTLWPELYGTERLGAVRALSHAAMVFASALGPVVMGYALDAGVTINAIAGWCAVYMLCASALTLTVTPDAPKAAANSAPDR